MAAQGQGTLEEHAITSKGWSSLETIIAMTYGAGMCKLRHCMLLVQSASSQTKLHHQGDNVCQYTQQRSRPGRTHQGVYKAAAHENKLGQVRLNSAWQSREAAQKTHFKVTVMPTVIGSLALLCVMLADDVGDLLLSPVRQYINSCSFNSKSQYSALGKTTGMLALSVRGKT